MMMTREFMLFNNGIADGSRDVNTLGDPGNGLRPKSIGEWEAWFKHRQEACEESNNTVSSAMVFEPQICTKETATKQTILPQPHSGQSRAVAPRVTAKLKINAISGAEYNDKEPLPISDDWAILGITMGNQLEADIPTPLGSFESQIEARTVSWTTVGKPAWQSKADQITSSERRGN
jgi:hypothetical protein